MDGCMNSVFRSVLTVGPDFDPPKGGIAQVVYNYCNDVFGGDFHFIANSCAGSMARKAACALLAVLKMVWVLSVNRQIRIVHIHTASYTSFTRSCLYLHIAKAMGRKVIMHVHGGAFRDYYSENRSYVSHQLLQCDCVVVLSDYWKRFMTQEVGVDRVEVVNNIIPKSEFSAEPCIDDGKMHAMFMGLLIRDKGIYDLIEAVASIKDELAGRFVLHVCGTGETEAVKARIGALGIDGLIRLEGWVSGRAKTRLMNQCRLYVLPSYIEGLPLSILEAMSYRMCIIATSVGSIPELLTGTSFGEMIKPGDTGALAAAVAKCAGMPADELQARAEAGYEASRSYWPDAVRGRLEQIYKNLISE